MSIWYAGCTGKRSRTGFVRLGEFGERELVSDFCFLEEAALLGEAAERTRRRLERGAAQDAGALGFMLRQVWLCHAVLDGATSVGTPQSKRSSCQAAVPTHSLARAADPAEEHAVGHPAGQRREAAREHELL